MQIENNKVKPNRMNAVVTTKEIQQMISEIITKKDRYKPLRDGEIEKMLCNSGVKISRRNVTKCRRFMKIPSAINRKIISNQTIQRKSCEGYKNIVTKNT